jgi:diguanylate cyclase (GGDEF)-like protein
LFILFMSGISRDLSHDGIRRLELTQALTLEKAKAETLARTDALTALLNRRALMEVGLASFANAVRHDRPFSVVMLDVDHFKRTNDRWGHSAGDVVLVGVADTVRSVIRTADLAGRIGGEEFAIFLPDTDAPGAVALAERLRLAVSDHQAEYEGQAIAITISLGVAERTPQDDSLEPIMRRADTALYEAKKNGRNRTRVRAA